jgi:hypothetical protein
MRNSHFPLSPATAHLAWPPSITADQDNKPEERKKEEEREQQA